MSATYRVITATALVRDVPQGRAVIARLRLGALFQGYPAAQGWVVRVVGGGYVRATAVALVDVTPLMQTGPNGLGDAVDRLAAFFPPAARAALSDYAAEVTGRAAAQSASIVAGLLERVAELERAVVVVAAERDGARAG